MASEELEREFASLPMLGPSLLLKAYDAWKWGMRFAVVDTPVTDKAVLEIHKTHGDTLIVDEGPNPDLVIHGR